MRIQRLWATIVVVVASAIVGSFDPPSASAHVRFDPVTGYFPSGYARPWSKFDTAMPPLAADGSALELGYTLPCPQNIRQAMISAVGPLTGSTLARSTPVIPYFDDALMASVPGAAEPTVIVAGDHVSGSLTSFGIEVFAGWPPVERARISTRLEMRPPGAIAVTRYVDADDFDFAYVDSSGVALVRVGGATASTLWGAALSRGRDVAFVPASGPTPALVIAVGDYTIAYDAATGDEIWSAGGGEKIVAGTIGVSDTPAFIIADPYNLGVRAYAANPPSLLWRRDDLLADSVLLDDLTGDGHNEVMVGTPRGVVQRLSAGGVDIGTPLTLPGATGAPNYSTGFAKARFAGTVSRFLISTDAVNEYTPLGVFVYPMNLAAPLDTEPDQRGVCGAVGVADIDGDGQDEIVTTGEVPGGYDGAGWMSTVRIAATADGREKWVSTLPPPGAADMYVDFDIGNLGHGADRDIVLAGPAGAPMAGVVSVLNGATHLVSRRGTFALPGANHVTAVRIVPGTVPAHELVVVGSDYQSTTLHVINAGTLQPTFSSDALAPAPDGGSVALATFAGDPSLHAIFTAPLNGVYSFNFGTHALDYSIPAGTSIGALLPPVDGVTRFAYTSYVDGHPVLALIDAATGAALDTVPVAGDVLKMAGDPGDPQRIVVEYADGLEAIRLDTHAVDGRSSRLPSPPNPYFSVDSLVVRASGGVSTAYAGTSAGVYVFRLTPTEASLFENGFDP